MNKDVVQDKYGRLYCLPEILAKKWQVKCVCLAYRRIPLPMRTCPADTQASWATCNAGFIGEGIFLWLHKLKSVIKEMQPDVIVASSDSVHIIVGALLGRWFNKPFIADLYDNYESFGLSRIPGVRSLYRWALSSANGIVTVSETLAELVASSYPHVPVLILESTVDKGFFQHHQNARKKLGINNDALIIGVCGGLNKKHDIHTVLQAFRLVRQSLTDVTLLLAGKLSSDIDLPDEEGVVYLGALPHDKMPLFYSAVNVAVITLSETSFGYYAFPQKVYEIMSCKTPAVATDIGALGRLFRREYPVGLYSPGDAVSLQNALVRVLGEDCFPTVNVPTWDGQADKLKKFIELNQTFLRGAENRQ